MLLLSKGIGAKHVKRWIETVYPWVVVFISGQLSGHSVYSSCIYRNVFICFGWIHRNIGECTYVLFWFISILCYIWLHTSLSIACSMYIYVNNYIVFYSFLFCNPYFGIEPLQGRIFLFEKRRITHIHGSVFYSFLLCNTYFVFSPCVLWLVMVALVHLTALPSELLLGALSM